MASGTTSSPPVQIKKEAEGGAQTLNSSRLTSGGFDGLMANVYVGQEAKQWTIHLQMFARYSPFFRQLCSQAKNKQAAQAAQEMQAAHQQQPDPPPKKARVSEMIEIRLPQWRPVVFGLLVHWVYASDILDMSTFPKARRGTEPPKVLDFVDLHNLGLELKMTSLCNAAVGEIYDLYKPVNGKQARFAKPTEILRVFKNTPAGSGLRELMTIQALLFMFSDRRKDHGLPEGWEPLLKGNTEVSWALLSTLSRWDWVAGVNTRSVTVKPKEAFYMVDADLAADGQT